MLASIQPPLRDQGATSAAITRGRTLARPRGRAKAGRALRRLLRAAARRGRRDAHGERKRRLVAWLFELRAEVLALEEAAERKRGNTTAQQRAFPPPWLARRVKQRLLTADAYAGG